MRRWLRCWLERPVHLSPEQGPKLSTLRLSAPWYPGSLHRSDPAGKEESVACEETLGQYTLLQESTQRPWLRHGTERDPNHASHGRRERESPQTSRRGVQAWSVRSSDCISDGAQKPGENPDDRDQRTYQERSRPSRRRV